VKDRPPEIKAEEFTQEIPYGSMAWRLKQHNEKMELVKDDGWD